MIPIKYLTIILCLVIQVNLLEAQTNSVEKIIKINKPSDKPDFRIEYVGGQISTKDIRRGKHQRIEIFCKGNKVFSDEARQWKTNYVYCGGGQFNYIHVIDKNDKTIFFNENGKVPIPDGLEITDMSNLVGSSSLAHQNYFWAQKNNTQKKRTEYQLFDFNCEPITDFFCSEDFEYNSTYFIIIKKDSLKTLILEGSTKPLLISKQIVYLSTENYYPTVAMFFITDLDNVNIYNKKTSEKLNSFKIKRAYTSVVLTDKWLVPYVSDNKIGLFSLKDLNFIPASYDGVSNKNSSHYFLARNKEKKYAVCDPQGNIKSPFVYDDYIMDVYEKNICLKKNNLCGVIDSTGKTVMKFEYYSIESKSCWNSYLEKFINTSCMFVKKDSAGKIAIFNKNGGMMSSFKYDEIIHDKKSNYLVALSAGVKEYFYIDGTPIDKNEAESDIYKSYVRDYNDKAKATKERMDKFIGKWNEVIEQLKKSAYYESERKNLFTHERLEIIKAYESLLYKNQSMLDNVYAKLTEKNKQTIEKNMSTINKNLTTLRNMSYNSKLVRNDID